MGTTKGRKRDFHVPLLTHQGQASQRPVTGMGGPTANNAAKVMKSEQNSLHGLDPLDPWFINDCMLSNRLQVS